MCHSVLQASQTLSFEFPKEIQKALNRVRHVEVTARLLTPSENALFLSNFNCGDLFCAYEDESLIPRDLKQIRFCEFQGCCILFQVNDQSSPSPTMLSHSLFENCRIEHGAHVSRTASISQTILLQHSHVLGCGSISGSGRTTFGNGLKVSPGLGTGERSVFTTVDSTLEEVSRVSLDQFNFPIDKKKYDSCIVAYLASCFSSFSICNGTMESCPEAVDVFVSRGARIGSGSRVRQSTLLAHAQVESGSDVISSLLQTNVTVSTQAIVRNSLVCRNSRVDCQGKVLDSVLGPNSHVAEGEVNSSLLGPCVGFHHQAMLIAAFWPRGRGNVAYGANCGSNHTSRLADQSLWPGEGMFFGLGCCVKLPMNLSEAPYSLLSTGAVFGPGRVNFPFSLISQQGSQCQVAPGWNMASNCYALERSECKLKDRISTEYSPLVFNSAISMLVFQARHVLLRALKVFPDKERFENDTELRMHLGGGFALRRDCEKGILAYTSFLQLFALRRAHSEGVLTIPVQKPESTMTCFELDLAETGLVKDDDRVYENYARALLHCIFSAQEEGQEVRLVLRNKEMDFARQVEESKRRDHVRGRQVFPDNRYDEAIAFDQDPVIQSAQQRYLAL